MTTPTPPNDAAQAVILIADAFQNEGIEALRSMGCTVHAEADLTTADLPARLAECRPDILLVRSTKVDRACIEASDSLSLILRAGAGYDTIDLETASARGISVANCPGMNAIAVAELAWSLILACDRRVPDQVSDLREGVWNKKGYGKARGLHGRTLGIVGLGRIGQAVAERGRAFGMKVIGWSRSLTEERAESLGIVRCNSPLEVAADADVVSLHVAANAHTAGMIDETFLAAMRDGATLINTTRGSLIDEAALAAAIDAKGLRVGLDVYASEPASGDTQFRNELVGKPCVFGTHHVGASTDQAQAAIAGEAVRIIGQFLETGDVPNCVNLATSTAASATLTVRHRNRPGVLASIFELVGEAGINVEEMENIIFDGSQAACAKIKLAGPIDDDRLSAIRSNEHVLSASLTPLNTG
ncbi:MAG: NAD(P)-dependent oxidoreductase [Planctomycetota bacterium]|nr:NAD(P)-dependent oxidoreductase [Planctomycetota bacterium]